MLLEENLARRLAEGLELRRKLASAIFAGGPHRIIEQRHPSVFGTLMGRREVPSLAPAPYQGDDRWAYVAAVLTAPSLDAQRPLVRSIVPPQDEQFVTLFTIGALMSSATLEPDALSVLGPADLSIVVESLAAAERLPETLRHLGPISSLAAQETYSFGLYDSPWEAIRGELPSRSNAGMAGFQRAVQEAKQAHVPLFGPDVFSLLQALSEPTMPLQEAQLEQMLTLAAKWGLDDLVIKLLLLRLVGPYSEEQAFLRRRMPEVRRSISARHATAVEMLLAPDPPTDTSRGRPALYFEAVSQLYMAIRRALKQREPSSLIKAVIDLYALDAALIGFLPWDQISRAVGEHLGQDARTAFMTYLMSEDQVSSSFPRVALRFGKGALIADLMSLIDIRSRGDSVNQLLMQVSALPERPAAALTRAILDRPIMERLVSSLPSPRAHRTMKVNEHHRISLMTISALRFANLKSLIPLPEVRRRFERELDNLRFDFLQGQFRSGRVRVAWIELKREIADLFAQDLPISAMQIGAEAAPTGLAPRLAAYSAQQITAHLLEGSENGINQALSSNLRHGVILPRYLKAFDDAMQAVWPKAAMLTWDEGPVQARFGEHGLRILALREQVSDLVKTFMDVRLTVEKESAFAGELQERIRLRLLAYLAAGGSPTSKVLPRTLVATAKVELRRHLRNAVKGLSDDVRKVINAEIKAMRRKIAQGTRHEVRSYVDSLETCLHQAHGSVREWMALVSLTGASRPFTLSDIVQLHLISATLDAREKLKVESTVTVNGVEHTGLEIRGELLGFFEEVVRNLLSNAFKGSGDDLRTQAQLRLVVTNERMLIRCVNAINIKQVTTVIENHATTVAKAQKRVAREAQKDRHSGFQKMRLAYKQAQMQQPVINIPPISPRTARFVIELDSALPPGGLFTAPILK
ncbi:MULTISPECIES: hypothetical protein [unclassified Brevundimonas]|uniref:hypothetical protein n=1 Tax=unclassified Brevundimonas TaxID=2622653 RepID=UPI000CFC6173|nr:MULTISPECIES: hypothetical protein [unclassified Brevundimonas]PQZ77360.1 hypothetical protein CQ026_13160 [Brevundimonas sp. MYb31]PRB37968.1 hypothetical protein CQ035_00715 [Brevundimonas sp. MYb46]